MNDGRVILYVSYNSVVRDGSVMKIIILRSYLHVYRT